MDAALHSVDELGTDRLARLVQRVAAIEAGGDPLLDLGGHRSALLFLEASTRTVLAFGGAIEALGGSWVRIDPQSSSLSKDESLRDTLRVLHAQGFDVVVVRAPWVGTSHVVARFFTGIVVNAGDGAGEHPSQAVQDVCTLARLRGGRADAVGALAGLRMAIVGDLAHSRVARSMGRLSGSLGVEVVGVAPWAWRVDPSAIGAVDVIDNLDEVLGEVDVLYMLRVQRERLASGEILDVGEYRRRFQLSARRLRAARCDVVVMHPGPVNRGVELDDAVLGSAAMHDGLQYALGVPTRMAILELLAKEAGWS